MRILPGLTAPAATVKIKKGTFPVSTRILPTAGPVFTPLKTPTRTITNPILAGPFISTQERAAATKNVLTSVTQKPAVGPLVLPKPYVAPKPVVQKNLTPLVTPKSSVPFQGRPVVTPVEQVQMKAAAPPIKYNPQKYNPEVTPVAPLQQVAGFRTGLDYFNRYTETALSTIGAIADTYAGYAWNKDTWNIAKERIKNNFSQIWSPPALEEAGVPAAIGRAAGNALSLAGTIITTYTLGKALVDFEQQIALNARRVAYYGKLAGQNPEEAVPGIGARGPAPKIASERSFAFTPDEMKQGVESAMSENGMTRQQATDYVNMLQEIVKTPYDKPSAVTYQSNAKEPGFTVGSAAFSPPVAVTAPAVPTNLPAGQGDILGFVIQFPDIAVKTGVVASASAASQLATLSTQVMAGQAAVTNLQAAMTASIPNLGVLAHYADLTRQPINEVMAEQARLAVPVGQPVTTRQTVAPTPVRTAIPAQATAPVSRILPYATEAPAVSSPVATISTRQLPIPSPAAPTTQPVAAATKQPYSVDLPDGSRLTITPPVAQVATATDQGVLYHGTNNTIEGDLRSVNKSINSTTFGDVETERHGIFLTDSPEFAKEYGKNVLPYKVSGDANIVDLKRGIYLEDDPTIRDFIASLDPFGKERDTWQLAKNQKNLWGFFEGELGTHFASFLKEQSYDGARFEETSGVLDGGGKEITAQTTVILNPTVLISESAPQISPSAAISKQETGATTPVEVTAPQPAQDTKPATNNIIPYTRDLEPRLRNMDILPRGVGARYLLVQQGQGNDLVAEGWKRTVPANMGARELLIDMKPETEVPASPVKEQTAVTPPQEQAPAAVTPAELQPPSFRDWRYVRTSQREGKLVPNGVGQKFTPEQIATLRTWVTDNGMSVDYNGATATGIAIFDQNAIAKPLDLSLYGKEGVRREQSALLAKQSADKDAARKAELASKATSRVSYPWIQSTFGDALGVANSSALSDVLEGTVQKFNGVVSEKWIDGLAKIGAITPENTVDWTKLKNAYVSPASVTPAVTTDPLTGLGTPEAWQTADKTDKIVATIDMNALLSNSKQYGPDFANTLRVIVAGALQQEGVQGYGLNKIEIAALFPSQEEADAKMAAVQAVIEETAVNATVDGKTTTLTGWRLDYGTGDDKESADAALAASRTDNARPRWNVQPVRSPAGAATQRKGDAYAANLAVGIRPEASSQQQIAKNNATPWVALGVQPTPRELLNGVVAMGYTLSDSSRQMFDTKELNRLPMLQKLFRKSGTKVIGLDDLASRLFSEYGIDRPQGDMQDDDWLAQQLVAGASKGAGNATKDLFGGEIRTRAVAPTEAQDTELFGKGQKAAFNTQQINAAERGRHLQGQNQRTEQVRQAPIDEGVFPGEVAGLPFDALNGNLGTSANTTGTQANQPTTAGYEMNVTPSTGTTARTIAAENIQKVALAIKDYVTTLASHPKMKESDYHAQLQDRLKQLGVPAGLFTPTEILKMYQASKGPSQLWNLTNRVLMKLNAYNTAQTLLAEALNDVPSSVLTKAQKATLQDSTLDNADFMRSLDFIDKELTKAQVTADLREKFDNMLAAQKEKAAARLARVTQRAADKLKTQEWLAADKTAKAKDKAEAAAIINYLQNLDLRNYNRPAAMSIQDEVAKAGITVKKPFVTEDYSPFVKALSDMGVHVADPGTAIADQKTLDLPELRALKAKVKALTDLSRLEKAAIATDVRETIEKKKEADIIQLNKGVKASDIENLRKGPYQAPKQGTMDKLLSAIKDVAPTLDVWLDRQQWLFRVLDGYQKGPLWSSLYDDAYRADHNSVGNIIRETGLLHQRLTENGITQKTIAQQRTLPNEMVVTQGDVLLMAAYAGNGHSLQSLVDKNGWSLETIQQAIESMSKGEVAWTNYTLDWMRNTYPLISDAFSRVNNGASLPDIANFFPMVKQFDPLKGMGQEEAQRQVEDFQELTLNTLSSYGWVNDGTDGKPSFVKHRIQHGEILLQTDVVKTFSDYVQGSLDYIERAPVVHSMETIIADKTFKDSFIRKAGLVRWNALGRYVAAVKSPRKALAARNGLEKAARTARFNASAATLGGRVSKAITSAMSYTFGIVRYGPTAMIYGTNELASDFYGSMATIKELAPILYERLIDPIKWEGVVDEMAQSWGGVKQFDIKKLWDLGFTVGDTLDVASSFLGQSWALAKQHPTWDDKKCAYEAEQDINQYHTSIKVQDRPEAWRSGEFANNVVAFMGEATAQSMGMFFEAKSAWHGKTPKAKFLMQWIVFTMLMGLMSMAADAVSNGRKKKTNDFWNTYAGYVVMANIELVLPFFGRWITGALQGYPASNNIIALKTFEEAKGVLTDLMKSKFGTAALDTLRTIGFGAGIPVLGYDELMRWFAPNNAAPSSSTTIQKPSKPTKPAPAVQKPHK